MSSARGHGGQLTRSHNALDELTIPQLHLTQRQQRKDLIRVGLGGELVLVSIAVVLLRVQGTSDGEVTFRQKHASIGELDRSLREFDGLRERVGSQLGASLNSLQSPVD